jgi:hypothetical protein
MPCERCERDYIVGCMDCVKSQRFLTKHVYGNDVQDTYYTSLL